MTRIGRLAGSGILAWALATGAAADASLPVDAPPGAGVLSGSARLKVKHCGNGEAGLTLAFALAGDGAWSADAPVALAGTSTSKLTSDAFYDHLRVRTRLVLSGASLSALEALLAGEATASCGASVSVGALSVSQATLVLNKRWTRARLRLGVSAQGASAAGVRALRYRVDAIGPWTPE